MSNHWIVRVGDGENFKNSKLLFWGVKKGKNNNIKSIVEKRFTPGDIIWFIISKEYGGKAIGVAEYTEFHDRNEEPLISINTYSNKDQNWKGEEDWDIQIHYKNLYVTEKQDIKIIIKCASPILNYETFKNKNNLPDLYNHYKNFKYYAEPKIN
jgi:hypothetical protein